MNRTEFAAKIAESKGISKAEAEKVIVAFIDGVSDAVKAGESVSLVGFGVFEVKEQEARTGRNPQTGAALQIAARKAVKFRAGETLKKLANGQ